ncbi:FAD-binding domain-containing protein [Mollisia scopiformis]|uniref:FAD-binding domain-containing protein n=1 Tax=Mollisia scopiformis TaxID=149040 RepID=A0A194WXL1_MOLSC|nr:FAD-binding domain-containing protein [Mollisia scopiformis]KUJ12670.1 FAD-binding domain-containing protein [Mollisia scopiformis]
MGARIDVLGDSVLYDPTSSSPGLRDSFYSAQQRDVVPACVITPSSPDEVAQAIQVIRQHNCIFAVKSGGHAMFVGASNAPGGITLDLKKLNTIDVSEDLKTARVGTRNRWRNVYETLEPLNRTPVGGRNGAVGVGGFILGGGISFVSRRYGWALDNVRNFEAVLANGSLSNINQQSSPNLYWALRGGGNNFGIVTNFDLEIYQQGEVWGGQNFWLMNKDMLANRTARLNISSPPIAFSMDYVKNSFFTGITKLACRLGYCITSEQAFRAFKNIVLAKQSDVYAQTWMTYTYVSQIDQFIFGAALVYSKPEVWPSIFTEFKTLKSVYSSTKIQNFTSVYEEVVSLNEIGYRQMTAAITFQMSGDLLDRILDVYLVEVQSVKNVKDIAIFRENGGNCLGLEDLDGPLMMFSLSFRWSKIEDDTKMNAVGIRILDRAVAMTKEMDLYHRYIYQNYANASQDVFGGYGERNRMRLKEIQTKYDPEGVFS